MLCIHINDDDIVHVCDIVLSSSLKSSPAHRHVPSTSLSSDNDVSRTILDVNGSIGNGNIDGGSDDGDEGDNDKDDGVSGDDDAPCVYDDITSPIKQSVSNIFSFLLYISIVSFFILMVVRDDDDDDVTAVLCDVDIVLSDTDDGDESSVSFDTEDNDFGLSTVISRKTSKVMMMMIMRRRKREGGVMVPVNKRFSTYFGGILKILNNLENK